MQLRGKSCQTIPLLTSGPVIVSSCKAQGVPPKLALLAVLTAFKPTVGHSAWPPGQGPPGKGRLPQGRRPWAQSQSRPQQPFSSPLRSRGDRKGKSKGTSEDGPRPRRTLRPCLLPLSPAPPACPACRRLGSLRSPMGGPPWPAPPFSWVPRSRRARRARRAAKARFKGRRGRREIGKKGKRRSAIQGSCHWPTVLQASPRTAKLPGAWRPMGPVRACLHLFLRLLSLKT